MERGKWNAITDVPGVQVGHVTLNEQLPDNEAVCTGVTAILPHNGNIFEEKVPAASFVLNGFGKTVGLIQIEELGLLESPIMLTNTFSVAAVLEGTLSHLLKENETIGDSTSSLNIVVGECNDSHLNSMRLMKVKPLHATEAIQQAESGPLEQGAVGAGKGMICYGMKGGIGSSSRIVSEGDSQYTVGVLTLTNFGKVNESNLNDWLTKNEFETLASQPYSEADDIKPDGSVMIVVATNAPVNERQLKRFAKRAAIGLGRTGTHVHNGSGDIIIAFSNGLTIRHTSDALTNTYEVLRDDHPVMADLFQAVIEATEEAVYQSLLHAETTTGRLGRIVEKWSD
ncbi:P1 family peptidase [Sporosarcina sp. CAU 1771]